MKRGVWAALVILALLVLVPTAGAQEATPVTPLEQAGDSALIFLTGIAGALLTAPVTAFIVGLLKRVKPLARLRSEWLALGVALLLTVTYWGAQWAGVERQLSSLIHTVEVVGPALLTLIGTLGGAGVVYNAAAAHKIPILGYQRQTARGDHLDDAGKLVREVLLPLASTGVTASQMPANPVELYHR